MKKRTVKLLLLHLLAALCLASLAGYGCPSYRLLRLRCPGCGLTRAWLLFLGGHLAEAFRMHALFLPAPFCILLLAHRHTPPVQAHRRLATGILCGFFLLLVVYHLGRTLLFRR